MCGEYVSPLQSYDFIYILIPRALPWAVMFHRFGVRARRSQTLTERRFEDFAIALGRKKSCEVEFDLENAQVKMAFEPEG